MQTYNYNSKTLVEVAEYLQANGFVASATKIPSKTFFFQKGNRLVVIMNDNVDFMIRNSNGQLDQQSAFVGISTLDLFGWMLLLHIANAVPLREFIGRAKAEQCDVTEALASIFKSIAINQSIPA